MLKWFSSEEGGPGSGAPGSPHGATGAGSGEADLAEAAERLAQTEQLVTQLKEMIREKDAALRTKDDQLKTEKEGCEAKLSKLRLQNKAKVTSLTSQLEELKKQHGGQSTPTHSKKGAAEGSDQASRGKIVLLRKKVEELEQQLALRVEEMENKRKEVEVQRQRGEEMDAMLAERDKKLLEKEAYIVHLQTALAGDQPITPGTQQKAAEEGGTLQELQLLVLNLTKKVGEGEERYSLLQEQADSLKALLVTEKSQYEQKENMYKQNIQTFKDIIIQKDNKLMEVNQMHEQELFKLAAKSDASADLEQLLKALKQKLHEKEEVLMGKTQVINVLQGEVDGRDQQIKELMERARRLQVERESLQSKLEAEKHVMRAQLRDLMEKQQVEVCRITEQHQAQMAQTQQDLLGQLEELRRRTTVTAAPANQQAAGSGDTPVDSATVQRLAELEAQAKQKMDEASKSEAKFLKMKAWSKSRIRQLEEEMRKSQAGGAPPDLTALRSRITDLEEEREESLWKLEQYDELKAKNDVLETKLVVYEEQQRILQADLEQVTKRAASQASESGSADDSQVLEWQEMVADAVSARDRAREEKAAMVLRISNMEEEREALASRQQELEEELAQGLGPHRAKKLSAPAQRSLQEDFEFGGQSSFQDPRSGSESTTPMEGENMGGWWPEYSTPDTGGLRSVVEELELERNQLQEQILGLEDRCQDLEDRLQLQARIETLQNESERLQGQLASLRSQQNRDAEKHQLLVTSLNEQLKGLSDTQECLESSLIEKENTIAETCERLELIDSLRESLREKETRHKEVSDKLFQTEHNLKEVSNKCSSFEKHCSELKTAVADLTQKLSVLKEKTQKQEVTIESLQADLDQTNDELDKLNTTHLEERAQLIHDLQSCERDIDSLKDILLDKDKEISTLSGNMVEYTEQITMLKQEIKLKEEDLVRIESALSKAEREAKIIRDSQDSDQHELNNKMAEFVEKVKDTEMELSKAKEKRQSNVVEVEDLSKQVEEDKRTIHDLHGEIKKQNVSHRNHLSECETRISSLKEQISLISHKLQESEGLILQLQDKNTSNNKLQEQLHETEQAYEKELKSFKEERNKRLAEVAKYNEDLQTLSKQLEEQVESQGNIKKEMQGKLDTIQSLEGKLKSTQKEAEGERQKFTTELQVQSSKNLNLGKELNNKCENISKLKNLLKGMKTEKQQLQSNVKIKTEELEYQKKHVDQLNEKVTTALQLNSNLDKQVKCLTEEKQRLKMEATEKMKGISELTIERDSLQTIISAFETQHSESSKCIEGLQRDKKELSVRINDLDRLLQLNAQSVSETLLEKTNECSNLNNMLREREEMVAQLQGQVQNMMSQVEQLQHCIEEKEQIVIAFRAELEAQQTQQVQLQETLSLLQDQGSTLKSGLLEKDGMLKRKEEESSMLQHDIMEHKGVISKLQAEAESLHRECSQLHQHIEGREETFRNMTQECQNHKGELNKRNESVMSLSSQLGVMNDNAMLLESEKAELKASLDNHVAENIRMRQEREQRQAEMVSVHSHIQALTEQNLQLRAAYKIREEDLAQQLQIASDLDSNMKVALEQNSSFNLKINSLTEDNQRLQQDVSQRVESISELITERNLLQEKISGLEMQHSENRKIIDGLLKDKDKLTVVADDLNKFLEQNKREKTTECNTLSKTLREREEQAATATSQVDRLTAQVSQLNNVIKEKEETLLEQRTHMEAQQTQLVQLQETLSLIQEQGSALKSGLMEKDTMFQQKAQECSSYQNEVLQQKNLISKMQEEADLLKGECLELNRCLEDKEQTLKVTTQEFQNHKDELNKHNESVTSLTNQLTTMNKSAAKMEVEFTALKNTVEKRTSDNHELRQVVDQKQTEVVDLVDNIQVLNEQNIRLKSELQKSVTEKSKTLEEITALTTVACDKDSRVSNLLEQLKAACSDKNSLGLMLQERDNSLKLQKMFIQQLQARSVEVEGQTSQKMETIVELQTKAQTLQNYLQDKDAAMRHAEKELSFLSEKITSDTENFKTHLESNSETIGLLQTELSNAVEKNTELSSRIAEQEVQLKQKVDENISVQAQVSDLEDCILKLRGQVDTVTTESSTLKNTLKEKEQFIFESQSASSAVNANLNSQLVAKESKCESMKEQLSHLQESVSKCNSTLQAQVSEMANLKEALEKKEAVLLDQSKSLQDMQRITDEAVLFRAQYMESTELVSQLQGQIQLLSSESANLGKSAEEKQSALSNLQEKYAVHLEELQDAKKQLSKKNDEVSSLSKALGDRNNVLKTAETTIEALSNESSSIHQKLQKTQEFNSSLSKQNEEALAKMSSLTVEIERLKSQLLQVAAQVNALTENLEQREMALHAINSQYTAQVKHTEHLVLEMQKLEEQNKRFSEEITSSKQEHQKHCNAANGERTHLQQELQKRVAERDELERSGNHQIRSLQEHLQLQTRQQSSSMSDVMEKMVSEKERLQAEVSVKGEEITGLKANIQKIEQILQDSEKEWLLVLDRETQDKNLLVEQLKSVGNEIKSKDFKVNVLKQDLDSLQEKLAEAASAIGLGSDQLNTKELEASASRVQLEKILASVQEKYNENVDLRQALQSMESELQKLEASKECADKDLSILSLTMAERLVALEEEKASLHTMMKRSQESHQCEFNSLKSELDQVSAQLQMTEYSLEEREKIHHDECEEIPVLKEKLEHLHVKFHNESDKVREAVNKHHCLHNELQAKDEQINCINIQISQQKELLAGLSQQLKEKDAAIAHVMESASNERLKHAEENNALIAQLGSMEYVHRSSLKQLETIHLQLEHNEASFSDSQHEIETKTSEIGELIKDNGHLKAELSKLSKEKDAMKKKLQAALVVRKDLLKNIEDYEKQSDSNGTEISVLQYKLEDITSQTQAITKKYEENIVVLEEAILQKEGKILELERERESIVEDFKTDKHILQTKVNEKEVSLTDTLHALNENGSLIEQLQSSMSVKDHAHEHDKHDMMQKLEELQNEMKKREDVLKMEISGLTANALDGENELAKVKQEKAILQKRAQAAFLARKDAMKTFQENEKTFSQEISELKEDYKGLVEQHYRQTNELNAVQLQFDQKVQELEDIRKASLSRLDELETSRGLVEERDTILQDLKMSLAEKETHGLQSKLESMSFEMASKDEVLIVMEQSSQALNSQMQLLGNDLDKAHATIKEKMEELEKCQQATEMVEQKNQQEKNILIDDYLNLQSQLNISQTAVEELKHNIDADFYEEEKYKALIGENEALLGQMDLMKVELETALDSISQKSLEIQSIQNTVAETQQQLDKEKSILAKELEKALLQCAESESNKLHMELLQQEKESAFKCVDQLSDDISMLNSQLKEAKELNEQLHEKMSGMHDTYPEQEYIRKEEVQSLHTSSEELEMQLNEKHDALLISQALVLEKEELIAALEQQLQRQIHLHEVTMEKMRTEVNELQHKSRDDGTKTNDQDNQSKTTLLTRKLQAALISRKDLLKVNTTLKEQLETLSAKNQEKEAATIALEISVSMLKQQNDDLRSSVSSLSKERDELISELDHILNDNHNLSAACESLKLTIENITQQKQAFSCQLESLKDSQTEELSECKSKHSELKQEYESLLQAYENVSSEMDKMRQHLGGARRERQEALRNLHTRETQQESLEKQVREIEEENVRMKEKMWTFAKVKQQKIEELELENKKIRKEFHNKQEIIVDELTGKNQQLEAKIHSLKESSEELREKLMEIQVDNGNLAEELKEAGFSLKKWHSDESKSCENNMQLKLDEALNLNNSLTAQIGAQKTELSAQQEISELLQREKQTLSAKILQIQNNHEVQFEEKENVIKELKDIINKHSQETISLNEKVRILEDDKSLLQEEHENTQEISDKVKNENEYLETMILKNSEKIDELTESINALHAQNAHLSTQLMASKEEKTQICQVKEEQQLRLVKEFEEKLKMAQRGKEGTKNAKKELQELLKEKHHEIHHLQQDCIKYQELVLDLEKSCKTLESTYEHFEKELKGSSEKMSILEERIKQHESELTTQKCLLQEATEEISRVQSDKDHMALEMSEKCKKSEHKAIERTKALENAMEQQKSVYLEREIILQEQIDELQGLKERETQLGVELKHQIDSQDLQINTLKREAETNVMKLAALSSTPQGADATKLWNDLFQNTLHEKDSQLLEQGFVIKRFLEEMRVKEKEANELHVTKSKLERALNEYSFAATAQQQQLYVMGVGNTELNDTVEIMNAQLKELSAQVERMEQERSVLNRQLADREDATSQMQLNLQQLEKIHSGAEAQLLLLQSLNDTLQVDSEKQEAMSLQLKTLLRNKDAEIASLLSSRDGQMSGYLEQLQANHRVQVTGCEDRLTALYNEREKFDKEFRRLETKVRTLQTKTDRSIQEKELIATKMETFRDSMVSLQTEREHLISEYRMLEARNQAGLIGREGSAEGDLNATKGLKHEIRTLLHQMDDLNSENAMLRAQLFRYREDLNQVLSLKDNQLKELLKSQQDTIKNLEIQKAAADKQQRESLLDIQMEEEASNALKAETSKLTSQVTKLEADILVLKKERAETNEGKVISDLQQAVMTKAAECNDLQQKLFSQKISKDDLKDKLQQLETETDNKLAEAEDKYNSELDTFEKEVELIRNERETADQRVEDLARDLLQTEQLLSEAKGQNQDMKAQSESLGKAMVALQNDRDQLIEDFKILQNRYDEELRETRSAMTKVEHHLGDTTSELAVLAKERQILAHKMAALESEDTPSELNKFVDELSKALSSKEGELKRVTLEKDTYSRQLAAFSRSMASLQNDRDRLMDELAVAKRVVESRQGSGPGDITSMTAGESNSQRSSVDAFKNEGDRLEMKLKVDELQRALQEAQAFRLKTEKEISSYQTELTELRSEKSSLQSECQALQEHQQVPETDGRPVKETMTLAGQSGWQEVVNQMQTERVQLHRDLQRCLYEIQQRDQHCQQLNFKLQQAVEEKEGVAAQLKAVSQTLRDTQNRCYLLESQIQGQALQGSVCVEVPPGAPQERSNHLVTTETTEGSQLQDRLLEVEQCLTEERARREAAEEALSVAEDREKSLSSSPSRASQRDFTIQLDAEEEWEALILNPNQPFLTRKVKGGVLACQRWLRGRSLYCSKLLTTRARSRYFFLAYLLTLHVIILMCLTGAL